MVSVGEGVLLLKVTQEMTTDYVFKDFAGDICEGNWAVVLGKVPVTLLEDALHIGIKPVLWEVSRV